MSDAKAFDALENARSLMTGRDPLPQNYLVSLSTDRVYARGTTAPALSTQFTQLPSGLLVPDNVAADAFPIDQVKVYLTAEESLGVSVSFADVVEALAKIPVEVVLPWSAWWLSKLHAPGAKQATVDQEFIGLYLAEPNATRVRNILRDPRRVLLTPQALRCLAKLSILICLETTGTPCEGPAGPLVIALLGLAEHLGADVEGLEAEELVVGERPGVLGREMLANLLSNSHRQEAGRWAVFQRVWRELPKELTDHPRVVDLEAAYESATGVPLDDLVVLCGAAWASAASAHTTLTPDAFDRLDWEPERLERALDLIACDVSSMRQQLRDEVEKFGWAWSTGTFEWFPIVRWGGGQFTVLDPELVLDRGCGVWPLYDIRRELEGSGQARLASKVSGAYDHVCEVYAREVVAGIVGGGPSARVYEEERLRKAFGKRRQTADIAVDYGHSWVVLDATTTGLQRATFAGVSDEAILKDLEKLVAKAGQIDSTISALRDSEHKLTGEAKERYRRFYPVVVTATKFATGPHFMTMLHDRLRAEGLLQGKDTAPLEVLEFEDLDIIEALVEAGGPSFLEVLGRKAESGLRLMPVRDYVLLTLNRRDLGRPARVERSWHRWIETALTSFRPEDGPESADAS